MRAYDIASLVDELDDLVHHAKPIPLTDQVRLDKEVVYDLLDQIRAALPRAGDPADDEPPPITSVAAEEAARSLSQLLQRVKFGDEAFSIEEHGVAMAELRAPAG